MTRHPSLRESHCRERVNRLLRQSSEKATERLRTLSDRKTLEEARVTRDELSGPSRSHSSVRCLAQHMYSNLKCGPKSLLTRR